MRTKKLGERVRVLCARVLRALRPPFSPITRRIHRWLEGFGSSSSSVKPQAMAYQLIGEKTAPLLPIFRDVDVNLEESELRIGFKAYVNLAIFTSLLVSFSTLISVPLMLTILFNLPFTPSLYFGLGGALFAGAFTIIGFYIYPVYRADSLKRDLEDSLPFTTSYMAILADAGVPPDHIFLSLANANVSPSVVLKARTIVRDVELFGYDVLSAMENASKRTPSEKFKEMLEGFIGTVHSGGDLAAYLNTRSKQYMKTKRIALRKFSDTLSILAEFYVTLLVAGPLILVVMLAVMGMLGGGSGMLDPNLLLDLLTYIGLPIGSIVFLILLDMVSPRY
jgi:flagellar protein FlaJ